MSWAKLLAGRNVTAEPPGKAELDNLRSIVTRCLRDAEAWMKIRHPKLI
jgi:hypothetical protein